MAPRPGLADPHTKQSPPVLLSARYSHLFVSCNPQCSIHMIWLSSNVHVITVQYVFILTHSIYNIYLLIFSTILAAIFTVDVGITLLFLC